MHDPKSIQSFLAEHFPLIKEYVEECWVNDRDKVVKFLGDCCTDSLFGDWARPYFADMMYWAKSAPHTYTNPWEVL